MIELCRRFVGAVNRVLSAVGYALLIAALVAFWIWNGGITGDRLECLVKGTEYMEARGAVCP
jgi:hypothetical protein